MKKKIILSALLIFFTSLSCISQSSELNGSELNEIETLSSEIFAFINSINDNINSFFKKEEANKFIRQLDYFQSDLEKYLMVRKELMDNLIKNDYEIDKNETKDKVSKLKKQLKHLSKRLLKISPYVSTSLSKEANNIVWRIDNAQKSNIGVYLTELDKLLNGDPFVDKDKLTSDGIKIYEELRAAADLIPIIRSKLDE